MSSPSSIYNPISCSLQLVFSRPSGASTTVQAGSTYQGTSVIRYRRESLSSEAQVEDETKTRKAALTTAAPSSSPPPQMSEYDDFMAHRRAVAAKHALHLHALTHAGGLYKDTRPLQVSSYHVSCVAAPSGGKTGPLKVLSVVQEDAAAAAALGAKDTKTVDKKSKGKQKGGKKSAAGTAANDGDADAAVGEPQQGGSVDWGSKLVLFEAADSLPLFSEVELTVQFTGTVQAFDHGGIYAARPDASTSSSGSNTANSGATGGGEDAPLLTHLEVRFARCAFPCPDDPQYRLEWQLKSLQLPDSYCEVRTNGQEQGRKALAAQHAVQWSFAPCGPLPVYTFSFACFTEALQLVEGTVRVAEFSGDATIAGGGIGGAGHAGDATTFSSSLFSTIPVRVLARRSARIPAATLDRVLRITIEAIDALQQRVFRCPFPLLQCRQVDVLLGPTMPFISGMEHHCSIILNETVYQPGKKAGASASGGGGGGGGEVEQTELIVHEVAHHWVGNALGLPFAVKEGICQVLEQCIGDTILGKPMRRFKPDSVAASAATTGGSNISPPNSNSAAAAAVGGGHGETGSSATTIQASEKGHEFTGTSYQHALSAIRQLVAERGFDAFEACLQRLVHDCVVVPMVLLEEQGGAQTLRLIGAEVPPPPYLSTERFLEYMEATP